MINAAPGYDLLREKLRANKIAWTLPAGTYYLQRPVVFKITNCYLTFSPYSTTGVTYARTMSFFDSYVQSWINNYIHYRKRENMKSWDDWLESVSLGFLGTVTVSQTFTKKMFIKEQSSENDTQFSESVQYKANIRRNLKEAPVECCFLVLIKPIVL